MSPAPPIIYVACDTAAFRVGRDGQLEALLVERGNEPFKGCWALPGGFVDEDEDLPDAAARELEEETGLRPAVMDQVGAWGTPGRDPRGRVVSVVYVAIPALGKDAVQGADDAARAAWHPMAALPPLAFDHEEVVAAALLHLKHRSETTHVAFAFLGESFSPDDVARVLHAIGFLKVEQGAGRLLAVADVEPTEADRYRLTAAAFRAPLREPVSLFPGKSL